MSNPTLYKYKIFKKACHLSARKLKPFESEISVAVSKESDEHLNDTPTSSPSPLAEIAMSLVCHFSIVTP